MAGVSLFDAMGEDAAPSEPRRMSLVRLSALIAQAAGQLGRVAVEGEVHRPQTGRTGRQWFTLRDRASQISVSVSSGRRSRCRVVAGERVCVTGRLEWVNDWGQLQLAAEEVLPVGEGAIAAMIADARRRLQAEGLLTRPRRPIPLLPVRIGVVCGHEAAVRADIESVVAARFPGYPMAFLETTVSGPAAADRIVAGKGKNVVVFDMKTAQPDDDTLAAVLLGPSGNLKAPTLRLGRTLLIGFSEPAYRHVFGK